MALADVVSALEFAKIFDELAGAVVLLAHSPENGILLGELEVRHGHTDRLLLDAVPLAAVDRPMLVIRLHRKLKFEYYEAAPTNQQSDWLAGDAGQPDEIELS